MTAAVAAGISGFDSRGYAVRSGQGMLISVQFASRACNGTSHVPSAFLSTAHRKGWASHCPSSVTHANLVWLPSELRRP